MANIRTERHPSGLGWVAVDVDRNDGPDSKYSYVGHGQDADEAILDLIEQLHEDCEDHPCQECSSAAIDKVMEMEKA